MSLQVCVIVKTSGACKMDVLRHFSKLTDLNRSFEKLNLFDMFLYCKQFCMFHSISTWLNCMCTVYSINFLDWLCMYITLAFIVSFLVVTELPR